MKTRVLSGLIMLPLLALVYMGGPFLLGVWAIVGGIGIKEFYNGFETMGYKPSLPIGISSVVLLILLGIVSLGILGNPLKAEDMTTYLLFWLVICVMGALIYMFDIENRRPEDSMITAIGIVYVVFFSFHVYLVDISMEPKLVWMIFITAFGSDIMAYFTGVLLGKHKLAPVLSPKKTIEGAIGGIIGSTCFSLLFAFLVVPNLWVHCLVLGIVCSPISMCGDLVASAFKRKMGIKDYGNLIPGHGGILDRFDSVIFVAPVVFYYIFIVLG